MRSIDFTEVCLYTVAPDDQFLVDFLPGRSDVIVASPCSGHGFKFSCLIGRVLADLADDRNDRAPHRGVGPLIVATFVSDACVDDLVLIGILRAISCW